MALPSNVADGICRLTRVRNTNLASEGPACLVLGGENGRLLGVLNGGLSAVQYHGAARVQELCFIEGTLAPREGQRC